MKRLAIALVAVLALAGCSSGGEAASSATADSPTAASLAADLDCTGDDGSSSNSVSCEFQDSYLGITVYKSKDSLKADIEATPVKVLVGPLWMIDAPDVATLEAAQAIVGGEIK